MTGKIDSSLIIPGSWNPAILRPNWVAKEVFGVERMDFTMEFTNIPLAPPKFIMDEITFIPAPNKLSLIPKNGELDSLKKVEDIGVKILTKLSHTPINNFGENFEFSGTSSNTERLNIFEIAEDINDILGTQIRVGATKISRSLFLENRVLNFSRNLIESDEIHFKFNFHYETTKVDEAMKLLKNSFEGNLEIVRNVANKYGVLIEGFQEATSE